MVITFSRSCANAPALPASKLRPVKMAKEFDQLRDDPGPARLVAGSEACAIVTVEIFVEQDVVFPLRIGLKFSAPPYTAGRTHLAERFRLADWRFPGPLPNRFINLPEPVGHSILVVAKQIERHQGTDQQGVHGHPYRTTPVGVSTEHAAVRFCREIVHSIFLAVHIEDVRMLGA